MDEFNFEYLRNMAEYFAIIDNEIASRLLRRIPSWEFTLTDELMACLDSQAIGRERRFLNQFISKRKAELNKSFPGRYDPEKLHFEKFSIRSFDHSRGFEAKVSNVDIGLLIEQGDRDSGNYRAYFYLLQAKRLKPTLKDDNIIYNIRSRFPSLDKDQNDEMLRYEAELQIDAFRYMFYMPRRIFVDPDYKIENYINKDRAWFASCGIWLRRIKSDINITPADVYHQYMVNSVPLVAILVGHVAQSLGEHDYAANIMGSARANGLTLPNDRDLIDILQALVDGDGERMKLVKNKMKIEYGKYPIIPSVSFVLTLPPVPAPRLIIEGPTAPGLGG